MDTHDSTTQQAAEQTTVNLAQRLVFTVNQYQAYLSKRLRAMNIGLSEYPVLIYLRYREAENAQCKVSQRDIAQRQHRDPALIARATRSLAGKGLISVHPDPDNCARNLLRTTPAGSAAAEQVEALVSEWEDAAQRGLDERERETLARLLARLDPPR